VQKVRRDVELALNHIMHRDNQESLLDKVKEMDFMAESEELY